MRSARMHGGNAAAEQGAPKGAVQGGSLESQRTAATPGGKRTTAGGESSAGDTDVAGRGGGAPRLDDMGGVGQSTAVGWTWWLPDGER